MKIRALRTRRPSGLSLLLGSIVVSCVSGCGDDRPPSLNDDPNKNTFTGGRGGDETGTGGTVGKQPNKNWTRVKSIQCESVPSVKGLNPQVELDSLSLYQATTGHLCTPPDYALSETEGDVCASSEEPDRCNDEVERLRAGSLEWSKYDEFWQASFGLLVATGSEENIARLGGPIEELSDGTCGSFSRGGERWGSVNRDGGAGGAGGVGGADNRPWLAPSMSSEATSIRDVETLRTLLGKIDTGNEAMLMFWAHDQQPSCEVYLDGKSYVSLVTKQISDCPFTDQDFEVRITPDGEFSETKVGEPRETGGCAGRRPDGLTAVLSRSSVSSTASWLEHTARLETAAVAAFAYLVRDLKRLGAPKSLVVRAEKAALDEIRHARQVREVALAHGATISEVRVQPAERRTLLSLAVENAVEGCVRECWGALVAHYQAASSNDRELRALWTGIALDESEHAALSFDLAKWFARQLTDEQRIVVEQARLGAVESLREDVCREACELHDPILGLPDTQVAAQLFAQLEQSVFAQQAA